MESVLLLLVLVLLIMMGAPSWVHHDHDPSGLHSDNGCSPDDLDPEPNVQRDRFSAANSDTVFYAHRRINDKRHNHGPIG